MSNFLRQAKRIEVRRKNKEVKYHKREFYNILADLNEVALQLAKNEEISDLTEDNIAEYAKEYTDRNLGKMETTILLSKLDDYKNRVEQRDEAKGNNKQEESI